MQITIVGPGALGFLFSIRLAQLSDVRLCLLDHNKDRAQHLNTAGITSVEDGRQRTYQVPVFSESRKAPTSDLALLCVKSHQVEKALRHLGQLVRPGGLLIALQNGIAHHRILRDRYDGNWAVGVTSQGAALEEIGTIRYGGSGETFLGFVAPNKGAEGLLAESARMFSAAGMSARLCADMQLVVWQKLIINVGINALTVLYDCPNGALLDRPEARERMRQVVLEAIAVAHAKGMKRSSFSLDAVLRVCQQTAANISSMLQDVRNRRKTEIDAINGALVHEAKILGLAVPENERLCSEIGSLEREYLD